MILHSIKKIILLCKQPNMGYMLCNSHLLQCRHYCDSSSQKFVSQKSEWNFTIEEEKQILAVLNTHTIEELQQYNMTSSQIEWIQEHRSKIGSYENLDDLLVVKGMGTKVIKKLYKSIVAKDGDKKKKSKRYALTIPAVPNAIRENINTVLSLCVGANVISWAQINRSSTLLNWNCDSFANIPENANLAALIPFTVKICYGIPDSDILLLEASRVIIQSGMNFEFYRATIQRHQLTASLLSILQYRRAHSRDNDTNELPQLSGNTIFLLKPRVTSHLFNLQIGSEVVSSESVVRTLFATSSPAVENILPVNVSSDLESIFNQKNAYEREQMSRALLQSVAFLNLCVFQNPSSLKARERKKMTKYENSVPIDKELS